jgi:hypothetical protein
MMAHRDDERHDDIERDATSAQGDGPCPLVPTEAELARAEGREYEPADKLLERILQRVA